MIEWSTGYIFDTGSDFMAFFIVNFLLFVIQLQKCFKKVALKLLIELIQSSIDNESWYRLRVWQFHYEAHTRDKIAFQFLLQWIERFLYFLIWRMDIELIRRHEWFDNLNFFILDHLTNIGHHSRHYCLYLFNHSWFLLSQFNQHDSQGKICRFRDP